MLSTTRDAARAILRSDPTITPAERQRLIALLSRPATEPTAQTPAPARLVRRIEAATRLGVCCRAVDNYAKRGLLPRVMLPGGTRALGFRESDLLALIAGGPQS